MPILSLKLTDLGPFDKVWFAFDPQANVFVGPNNCGKSTVLFALARYCAPGFSVPARLLRSPRSEFYVSLGTRNSEKESRGVLRREWGPYPIAKTATMASQEGAGPSPAGSTPGSVGPPAEVRRELGYTAFIPALRWSTGFRSSGPSQEHHLTQEYFPYRTLQIHSAFSIDQPSYESAEREFEGDYVSLIIDRQIIQEIIELDYRSHLKERPAMRSILDKIAATASEITEGFSLKFAGIDEDKRGFYPAFETPDGRLPLDVLSQGTQSLIQWLARLFIGYARHYDFPKSLDDKPGILIIDEIDAHLHPSWQRRIIPKLTKAFPSLQVFCSTHSPLMLAGLKAGQIHLLRRDAKGKVVVSRNETDIVGWSADEIITSFLGVDSATDMRTEEALNRLEQLRAKSRLSTGEKKELEKLRSSVSRSLLSGPATADVEQTAQQLRRIMDEIPPPEVPGKPRRTKNAPRRRPERRQPTKRSRR